MRWLAMLLLAASAGLLPIVAASGVAQAQGQMPASAAPSLEASGWTHAGWHGIRPAR